MKLLVVLVCVAAASALPSFRPQFNPAPVPVPFKQFNPAPAPVFKPKPQFNPAPVFKPAPPVFKPQFTPPIQRDCVYSQWTQWSECSANGCGAQGFRSRTRAIQQEASGYGQKCSAMNLEEWAECSSQPCDCQMGNWAAWNLCGNNNPEQCGTGQRERSRPILAQPGPGGRPCLSSQESESCALQPCKVHCQMTQWAAWTRCSADCGEGRRSRTRSVLVQPQNGGLQCGPAEDWESCFDKPCAQNCAYSNWADWSACPSCGEGVIRSRDRQVTLEGKNGGVLCDFASLAESETCRIPSCAVDCQMDAWTAWTRCSADCGEGRRSRTRSVLVQAQNGGLQCGPVEDWEACKEKECAVHCEMSAWSRWSLCNAQCGGGQRQRSRTVQVQAQFGGLACGPVEDFAPCNQQQCEVNCEYSNWSSWSACPVCGQADRSRARQITTFANSVGVQCDFGDLLQSEQCNTRPCAVHCEVSAWTAWTQCTATCGQGSRSRTRAITQNAAFGGRQCPELEDWAQCNNGPCAVHCEVTNWSQWSACSADCGGGSQSRTRAIAVQPNNAGRQCPTLEDWQQCNQQQCAPPSICANTFGTQFIASGPCESAFTLCSNGNEFQKTCPGDFKFNAATKNCAHPSKIRACPQANPAPRGYGGF